MGVRRGRPRQSGHHPQRDGRHQDNRCPAQGRHTCPWGSPRLEGLLEPPPPVAITVSHGCSLAQHTPEHLRRTAERLAPIHELQHGGVTVAVGGDNVADPWFPGGNFHPLELWRFAVPVTHLHPWEPQGLAPFTSAPARVLGLSWDGVLRQGCPADLILSEASSWQALLAVPQRLRVLRNGRWLP